MDKISEVGRHSSIKRVNLISGGIDSYIMAETFKGINVYVNFGQKYAEYEIAALRSLEIPFEIIEVKSRFKENEIYIADRNLFLATTVNMVYEPDEILIAGLKDDNCKDKTEDAFKRFSEILSLYGNKQVQVKSPYFDKTKGEIVAGFKYKKRLTKTFSCYNPTIDGKPCGNCPACLRKAIALETNGIIDYGFKVKSDIIKEYIKKIDKYDADRVSRFFLFLKNRTDVWSIDIDGVLCNEKADHNYKNRIANSQAIKKINQLTGVKVIYTARLESDREETKKWLSDNNVKYDALIMNKIPSNKMIDDRAIKPEELV